MPASIGAAVAAYEHGASLLRVHDVRETVEAIAVAAAVERGAVAR
jgi:dihydropteroate synthase